MALTYLDYLRQLQSLLPSGPAWTREPDSYLEKLQKSLAVEFSRIDQRGADLFDQVDPRTADEMLAEWEKLLGLPDACMGDIDSALGRHAVAHAKLTASGGASKAYFEELAERLGYDVTITEFGTFMVELGSVGDPLGDEEGWNLIWQINGPSVTVTDFSCGISTCGQPLRSWGNDLLECAFSRLKPAHTKLIFAYEEG